MSRLPRPKVNPFYVLLVVAGVAFGLTACVYGLALLRELRLRRLGQGESVVWLAWVSRHGVWLLVAELGVLAVATFAAIGLDDLFSPSANSPSDGHQPNPPSGPNPLSGPVRSDKHPEP